MRFSFSKCRKTEIINNKTTPRLNVYRAGHLLLWLRIPECTGAERAFKNTPFEQRGSPAAHNPAPSLYSVKTARCSRHGETLTRDNSGMTAACSCCDGTTARCFKVHPGSEGFFASCSPQWESELWADGWLKTGQRFLKRVKMSGFGEGYLHRLVWVMGYCCPG